ncbi:MAG: heme-copper oxidase subunit III [Sphingobacteriia bacterium]|nr:heme-copper oxidase subunit III [Sphingobacteriia bacterium]
MMTAVQANGPQRIHRHKFTLWVAMGSMVMMFAGLTSAYIVKKNQSSWLEFNLPVLFWYSTAVILVSSFTIQMAVQAHKAREMGKYRALITLTALLGLAFLVMQIMGFLDLESNNIALTGSRSNSAASFLLVITGLHMLHVLGGVVAILFIFIRAYNSQEKAGSSLPVELAATYWHFVDVLWIYLFIFYNWIG